VLAVIGVVAAVGCGEDLREPIEIDLAGSVERTFEVDGAREVIVRAGAVPVIVEGWVDGGVVDAVTDEQRAAGAPEAWLAPRELNDELRFAVLGDGEVTLAVHDRGAPAPAVVRARGLAWLDGDTLDDPAVVSFARVMAAISDDGHGGRLLQRWFEAFAEGPGAGRAAFAQILDDIESAQGADPAAWDLAALPMKVTGVHNRHDLGRGDDCGELRVSIASAHPTFSPVHFIFLFRSVVADDDVTPDGTVHCRGSARRWARLATLDAVAWKAAAVELMAATLVRDRFLIAESVELSISPWQWRQWRPDGNGGLVNPPLFQTVDVARVSAGGSLRDAFLEDVRANADAIAARTWSVPDRYRSPVAEVQPNQKAALVDLSPLGLSPELPRALGMVGCPRCHTDDADFLQTGFDRRPSPFYDRELDARAARLDAINRGAFPPPAPFGPLQPL
jgi:hypothetical protein